MNSQSYIHGFLITTALLVLEHLTLYARLRPRGDSGDAWRVLIKFTLGVLAILTGCAVIAWEEYDAGAILAPVAASSGGLIIAAGYIGRWLFERANKTAYVRGWLTGLADKGDLADEPARERDDRRA